MSAFTQGPKAHRSARRSIQFKIAAGFVLFSIALIATAVLVLQVRGKQLLVSQNYRLVEETGTGIVSRLGAHVTKTEGLVLSLAQLSENLEPNHRTYREVLPNLMLDTGKGSMVAGGGVWPEPRLFDPKRDRASYFYGRQPDGSMKFFDDYNDPQGAGYHREEWYVPAKHLPRGRTFWSRSYMDPYSYEPMVTCTAPIYRGNRLWGVETIDLMLSGLAEFLKQASAPLGGYAFAVDRNNKLLSFPDVALTKVHFKDERGNPAEEFIDVQELARKQPVFQPIAQALTGINQNLINKTSYDVALAYLIAKESNQISAEEGRLITATFLDPLKGSTESSFMLQRFTVERELLLKEPSLVSVFHVPKAYWKLVLVTPISKTTAGATTITRTILFSLLGTLLFLLSGAFLFVRRIIISPIHRMASTLEEASHQGMGAVFALDEQRPDELGELAHWLNLRTSQWKEAMESLKSSEREYRVLFENIQDLFYCADADGRLTLVSPSLKRILGYEPSEVISLSLADMVYRDPEDRKLLMERLLRQESVEDYEIELKRADGAIIQASVNTHLVRGEQGEILGVEGTVRDISSRKRAEHQIELMRSYLKNIFDSMPSMLISTDPEGLITEWNQAAVQATGILATDAMGKPFWELAPLFSPFKDDYQDVIHSRHPRTYYRLPFHNGETKYHDVTLYPLVANGIHGMVIRIDDITEMERKDNQLRQAQKMETIGTLAGGLAHDMNNVLCGITGSLSLLKYRWRKQGLQMDEESKDYISTMEESTQRAVDIIRQLLSLSRKQELSLVPLDLNMALHHVERLCKSSFDKCVEVQAQPYSTSAFVHADISQIEQVLLNLCVNGAHAMTVMQPEGTSRGGKLTLQIEGLSADRHFCGSHPEARETEYWVLSVRDTGVGMDTKTVAKIFDPFFTTKAKEKGTGLGLTMAYNIIHQHGGFIDVYSEPNIGSTFSVYLPAQAKEAEPFETRALVETTKGEGLILVVDDEPVMRSIAQEILEECGYEVLLAENGEEGVSMFHQHRDRIRAVMLDLIMPKMDGREACREILRSDPQARILIASGFKQDERIEQAMSLGATGFVQKPYTLEILARAVSDLLRQGPTG